MIFLVLLVVLKGIAQASFVSELGGGCAYMAGAAVDPGSHVKKLAKDASDFEKFPDKSKLPQKTFTWEEVKQFDGEQGRPMYLVIDNNVYDFTNFADLHPAGPEPLKQHAGNDASAAMRAARMPSAVMDVYIHRFKVGAVDVVGGNWVLKFKNVQARKKAESDFNYISIFNYLNEDNRDPIVMAETQYRLTDVQARNGKLGAPIWIVYKDSVYDVTSYVEQHPGGDDAVTAEAGTDATSAFQDVGHSDDAKTVLAKYKIGEIIEEEKKYDANGKKKKKVVAAKDEGTGRSCLNTVTCGLLG
ncbi:uncharacterized protein LOC134794868 [Cydia splendana]|uniref:uncharacterized protein LOC134794868 n=1 Tax=Cydia splendana TaxID=1100963 RepID=UPI00300CCB9E